MSNTILTASAITRETLRVFMNNCPTVRSVSRKYDSQYAVAGAKIGDTLNIRKPARFTVRDGRVASVQNYTETSVPLQLSSQKGVDLEFTSKDLTLSLDDFSERVIKPAIVPVANKVELDLLNSMGINAFNAVGTPGTTPTTLLTYLQGGAKLDFNSCPVDNLRHAIVDPLAQASIVDALKALFQSSEQIANQYKKGTMGLAAGFTWHMGQNVRRHTVGPLGGTPLVNGASQTGSSLITDGWTAAAASRLKQGDVFTIADVYQLNPVSLTSTGQLQQFVVTADVSSDGSGNATISISPSITTTGAFATVNASPADNAALTILGAANTVTPCNLLFHRDSTTFGTADLEMPANVWGARISDEATGLSVRLLKQYDIREDTSLARFDILYGIKVLYPEWICRVQG